MSAAPRYPSDLGYVGLCMNSEEFRALGETPERLELVHGVVVMSPSPTPRHQFALRLLLRQFEVYADANPGVLLFPDTDVMLSPHHIYRPDLSCYRAGRYTGIPVRLDSPPDVVVEILSAGTKAFDLTTKPDDYERFGVGEYWILDPDSARVRCYQRRDNADNAFVEVSASAESMASAALPGFALDVRVLRDALR